MAWDPQTAVIFGKPHNAMAHRKRLKSLAGRSHELHTAWVVFDHQRLVSGISVCRIHMRHVSDEEIDAYVSDGEGAGCAGGYAVEGKGSFLIDKIEGDWFAVIGLPLYDVHRALREFGWRFTE